MKKELDTTLLAEARKLGAQFERAVELYRPAEIEHPDLYLYRYEKLLARAENRAALDSAFASGREEESARLPAEKTLCPIHGIPVLVRCDLCVAEHRQLQRILDMDRRAKTEGKRKRRKKETVH